MVSQIQKTVLFYGDQVTATQLLDSGSIFVPLNQLCDNLGIQRYRQVTRIRAHAVLSQGLVTLALNTGGGSQDTQCLRLDLIPLWLAGVNAKRVAPAVQEKLIRYQTEAAAGLWAAFRPDILPAEETVLASPGASGAAVAYEIATAIQHLARQQMELEQRLGGRIDRMAHWAKQFSESVDERFRALELQVAPHSTISEQQAAELALAVKAVGQALADRGSRSGYGQVYGELYRRYSVSSYKNLPQSKYTEVLNWLHMWHTELIEEPTNPS